MKTKNEALRKSFGLGAPGKAGAKPGGPPAGGPPAGGPGGGRPQLTQAQRDKMKALREEYTKGLKAVLTPTQFTNYEKGMKDMMAKMRAQFGGGPGGPGGPGAAGKKKGTPPPQA